MAGWSQFPPDTMLACILEHTSPATPAQSSFPLGPPPHPAPAWASPYSACSGLGSSSQQKPLAAHVARLLLGAPHQHFQGGRQHAVVVRGLLLQAAGVLDPLQLGRVLHVDALCREGGCGRNQRPVREPSCSIGAQLRDLDHLHHPGAGLSQQTGG